MSLRRLPRRLAVCLLATVVLATALPPAAAAADPRVPPVPGGRAGLLADDRFKDLDAAARASVLDPSVLEAVRARGSVEAIVTFDGNALLSRAAMKAPEGSGRSDAILAAVRPEFAAQKQRAFGGLGRGLRVLESYESLAASFVRFRSGGALLAALNRPGVSGVRENRIRDRYLDQSLPLIGRTGLDSPVEGGVNTSVAVLDTGVDYTRGAFGSCVSPGIPEACRVSYAADFATDDGVLDGGLPACTSAPDYCHGTNVSATVLGVAPGTRILSFDVFESYGAPDSVVLNAIDWVVAHKSAYNIKAMNLSLGSPAYALTTCWGSAYAPAFASARAVGVVPVVASGNGADLAGFSPGISEPACAPGAMSVGAVYDADIGADPYGCGDAATAADKVTCFSETAPILSMLAPGALITAADIPMSGTSQAAPHVAGAVAVLAEKHPAASPYQLQRVLQDNGVPVEDTRPSTPIVKERLDLPLALAASLPAKPIWADPPLFIGKPDESDFKWSWWSSQASTSATGSRYIHNVKMNGADPDYPGVEYMRSTNQGATWAATKRLNPTNRFGEFAVTASSGTHVYVAWMYWSYGYPYPRVLQFRANTKHGAGAAWLSTKGLSPTNGYIDPPTIAASGAYVYAAWTDSATGNIRFRRSSDRGVNWSTPVTVGTTTATDADFGRSGTPVLAASGSYVTIAWIASDSGTLKQRISANRGTSWGTAINLDTNANYRPSIAASASRFAFAWTDATGVRVRIWNAGSWLTSVPRQVAAFSSSARYKLGYSAAVAVQGTGVVEVAWTGCRVSGCAVTDTQGRDLLWRRSTTNAATWATGQTVLVDSGHWEQRRSNDAADIDFVSASRRHITWNGYTPGYESRMYLLNGG